MTEIDLTSKIYKVPRKAKIDDDLRDADLIRDPALRPDPREGQIIRINGQQFGITKVSTNRRADGSLPPGEFPRFEITATKINP